MTAARCPRRRGPRRSRRPSAPPVARQGGRVPAAGRPRRSGALMMPGWRPPDCHGDQVEFAVVVRASWLSVSAWTNDASRIHRRRQRAGWPGRCEACGDSRRRDTVARPARSAYSCRGSVPDATRHRRVARSRSTARLAGSLRRRTGVGGATTPARPIRMPPHPRMAFSRSLQMIQPRHKRSVEHLLHVLPVLVDGVSAEGLVRDDMHTVCGLLEDPLVHTGDAARGPAP